MGAAPVAAPLTRTVRALVHAALAALVATWWIAPERTGACFGGFAAALIVLSLALHVAAHARPRLAGILDRARRVADLASLAFLATFLLAEVELRLLARVVTSPLLAPPDARADDLIRTYRLAPGQALRGTVANPQGFLDAPFVVARRPGTKRVVALADSFGVGVVEWRANFLTRLDDELDALAPSPASPPVADPVEVLNFGVISTSPREYLQLWNTEAARYEPDLVLLCFFVGNDWGVHQDASLLHADASFLVTFVRRFVALAREHRAGATAAAQAAPNPAATTEELPTHSVEAFDRIERERLELARTPPPRAALDKFAETGALFERIVAAVGPRLRVAILPDEYQVNDTLFARLADGHPERFDRAQPSVRLAAWLDAHHVPFLDLREPLRAAEAGGSTYRLRDTHWNERGNAAASAALAAWLAPQLR